MNTQPPAAPVPPLDWASMRQRLDALAARASGRITAEQRREVLRQRARELARVLTPLDRIDVLEVLEVRLGTERFGVPVAAVQAVAVVRHVTPVPGAAPPLVGIAAWRGELLELFDLRSQLGLNAGPPADSTRVVVIAHERAGLGILVDAVDGLALIDRASLREPALSAGARRALVAGITEDALAVLDTSTLLQIDQTIGGSA